MKDVRLANISWESIEWNLRNIKERSKTCIRLRGGYQKALRYWDVSCGFDIETTNTRINKVKYAWMYEWTFGIDDYIIMGRTWQELHRLFDMLAKIFDVKTNTLVIFVHNWAFEYSYMKSEFDWLDTFEVEARTPLRSIMTNGLEFRCSSLLAGTTLETVAKNLHSHNTKKLVGDLDYSLIRTELTNLTYQEYQYCINDVQILLDYIDEQREIYNDIAHLPYTNTGRVREYCRNHCLKTVDKNGKVVNNADYRDLMKRLTLSKEEYELLHGIGEMNLHGAFAGGFTHASPIYNGDLLENVTSYDLTSAYPTVMVSEKYPMTKGYKLPRKDYKLFNKLVNHPGKLLVFMLHLYNVEATIDYDYYISKSKCNKVENPKTYNGRLVSADYLEIAITSVDYKIIQQCYKWSKQGVSNVWCYGAGYLPTPFVECILKLYNDKTKLKGVREKIVEYMLSKEMLNSSYGMTVQSIDDLEEYNHKRNRFLFYPWGVFVTAYNRARVWEAILELKDDYVYTDTDSVKALNIDKHIDWFNRSNEKIREKLYKAMDYHKLPRELVEPLTIKGKPKLLGAWDLDGVYRRFKTLGAKRYLVEEWNDDDAKWEFVLTNAGIKKGAVECMGTDPFKTYRLGLKIPAEFSGKLCHTYIDIPREADVTDYQGHTSHICEHSSCHLEPVGYEIGEEPELVTMIEWIRGQRNDL